MNDETWTITIQDGHGPGKERRYTLDELDALCEQLVGESLGFAFALFHHVTERVAELAVDTRLLEIALAPLAGQAVGPELEQNDSEAIPPVWVKTGRMPVATQIGGRVLVAPESHEVRESHVIGASPREAESV